MPAGPGDYASAVLSPHALQEMTRRGISESDVRAVLRAPGRTESVRPARVVLSRLEERGSKRYVLRVFVDVDRDPPVVVTAYRSSKIGKYWSQS